MADPVRKVDIRRMILQDVPAVHDLDVLSFALPWSERSFRYEVTENDKARNWVAEAVEQGKPTLAGMLVLWLILDEAHIATLAVRQDHRRQGIAHCLLRVALEHARQEGARRAFLEVRAGNQPALAMYRQLGFVQTGLRLRYYHDNNEDAILMTLEELDSLATVNRSEP